REKPPGAGRATLPARSAGFQPAVSQGFQPANLPYSRRAQGKPDALPIGNRRYSRLETCATSCVPLNVHSQCSFLDSTLSISAIVDFAARHDLPAIALTDRENLHGAVEFSMLAAKAGIKPIIGAELDWNGKPLCLYVQNQTGYRNLCRIL